MVDLTKLKRRQVGRLGELLVQYELLKHGVESAPMTTDYGIDLLAMRPADHEAVTIQMKTRRHRERGSGSEWVVWDKGEQLMAQYIALVDLERDKGWLFKKEDFEHYATGGGHRWLWWYISGQRPKRAESLPEEHFAPYELDNAIHILFRL